VNLAPGALTDVPGLRVGHAEVPGHPTGCSVVLCPPGTVGGVAVRGGSPGTRETDLLRPENTVDVVHAVLLTGGSAYGLDAAGGVMRWLEEQGIGLPVGPRGGDPAQTALIRVPIVPAAVLFDLWLGDGTVRPTADTGRAACMNANTSASTNPSASASTSASAANPTQGSVGAGAGATVGKLWGIARAMKGGIGTASLTLGDITVAALVAVNAIGDVLDEQGQVLAGARSDDKRSLINSTQALLQGAGPERLVGAMSLGTATTIGVVATNARLTKAQATQLAGLAHHGLSRAVSPVTAHDGDTLFALATGSAGHVGDISAIGAMAAEVVARAIRNGVLAASGLAAPDLPAWADFNGQPSGR